MEFFLLSVVFILSFMSYVILKSYSFQLYRRTRILKKLFLDDFLAKVKGDYQKKAYFAVSHHVISTTEYNSYTAKHKKNFTQCYNVVKFKTPDAHWELFFHLIKDGFTYSQIMTLRVFPISLRIKSEGNVEKNYGRLNIFTNNRYLTHVLEENETQDYLRWLIRHNNDILLILPNNLHFKVFLSDNKFSANRGLDMVKALNYLKNKVYKKEVMEY